MLPKNRTKAENENSWKVKITQTHILYTTIYITKIGVTTELTNFTNKLLSDDFGVGFAMNIFITNEY